MKDSTLLILASLAMATLAWAFWTVFGNDGFSAITLLAIVVLITDNARLRRQLRAKPPGS